MLSNVVLLFKPIIYLKPLYEPRVLFYVKSLLFNGACIVGRIYQT